MLKVFECAERSRRDAEVSLPQEAKTEKCGHAVRTPYIWELAGSNFGSQTGYIMRFSQFCQANTGTET
jgi:hypothetical protein